ncbi:hypothetical protein GN956_G4299 [Arapaima gigas]
MSRQLVVIGSEMIEFNSLTTYAANLTENVKKQKAARPSNPRRLFAQRPAKESREAFTAVARSRQLLSKPL